MSYEGYYEYKCRCGHIDRADAYETQPTECTGCGTPFYQTRSIDLTNGRDVYPWRDVEYRKRFKDYVAAGIGYDGAEWFGRTPARAEAGAEKEAE